MVPDKFNMVDMGGIDLIESQGVEVPGLYEKLVESITRCRYQCLYNWMFDGVIIPPTYVQLEVNDNDEVAINEGVTVDEEDIVHIHSLEIPIEPIIQSISVTQNGEYLVPEGVDGFNPVSVEVIPPLQQKTATSNGEYEPDSDYYGLSKVIVNVPATISQYEVVAYDFLGLATAYVTLAGEFWSNPTKNQCLFIAPVEYGKSYVVFLPETYGNRFRACMFSGKTIEDFEPYLDDDVSTATLIYSGGTMVTPRNSELSQNRLKERFYFSGVDGVLVVGTSNESQVICPVLLKINS